MTLCAGVRKDRGMPREPFKFLNTDEFERLTLDEKISYVQRAIRAINRMHKKAAKDQGERRKRKRK
jgi:hypothetical protein